MKLEDAYPTILKCIEKKKCTYAWTGGFYHYQPFYWCETCCEKPDFGVCETCKDICHAGHTINIKFHKSPMVTAFCDCPDTYGCRCISPTEKTAAAAKTKMYE